MSAQEWYQSTILLLLIIGLVPAAAFIGQHRPRQWRRAAAWDASGFVVIAAAIYLRNAVLVWTRWPGSPPKNTADAVFAIGSLVVIDALLILRIVSYRSFAQRDQQRISRGSSDDVTA